MNPPALLPSAALVAVMLTLASFIELAVPLFAAPLDRPGRRATNLGLTVLTVVFNWALTSSAMDTGVRIPAAVNDDDIHILPDGTVRSNATVFGKLRLAQVRAPEGLQAVGDNDFAPTATSGAPAPLPRGTSTTLTQRVLEGSNVDLATAMTDLIDAQRGYEMASKAINTQDHLYEIANGVKR